MTKQLRIYACSSTISHQRSPYPLPIAINAIIAQTQTNIAIRSLLDYLADDRVSLAVNPYSQSGVHMPREVPTRFTDGQARTFNQVLFDPR
jgi:hypothetical protein